MEIKEGDRVRYKPSFLEDRSDGIRTSLASLVGTVMSMHTVDGEEMAQIDFGSVFRSSSLVPVEYLELI